MYVSSSHGWNQIYLLTVMRSQSRKELHHLRWTCAVPVVGLGGAGPDYIFVRSRSRVKMYVAPHNTVAEAK
jgi:hypothetical protein